MTLRPLPLCVAVILSGMTLALSAARAFTFENGQGNGQGSAAITPQFDIEEQARQFRKGQFDTSTTTSNRGGTREVETPFGKGVLQFGVTSGPTFGSPFGFNSGRAAADRRYLDRMVAPPGLQHRYDD